MAADVTEPSDKEVMDLIKTVVTPEEMQTQPEPEPVVVEGKETPEVEPAKPGIEMAEAPAEEKVEEGAEKPVDDLESLKASLFERDEKLKAIEEELKDTREKAVAQYDWARKLGLQSATEADRYKKAIEGFKSSGEVDVAEIDKVLSQPSVQQEVAQQFGVPAFGLPQQPDQQQQNLAAEVNRWAWGEGVDGQTVKTVVEWSNSSKSTLTQADLASGHIPSIMSIVLAKYREQQRASDPQLVKATKVVQRAQKRALAAAGTVSARATPSPPAEPPKSLKDSSTQEMLDKGIVGELVSKSLEER